MLRAPENSFAEAAEAKVAAAFAGRLTVGLGEAARILEVGEKILRRHAILGSISFTDLGHGSERRRRRFSAEDLVVFLRSRRTRSAASLPGRRPRARAADEHDEEESFEAFVARTAAKRNSNTSATGDGR
ncbi:MAG: hypothetical protein JSR61_20000 [Proteobacteria bacterium]|nr:hypothetical protein [Pseudomonadota bacterium]